MRLIPKAELARRSDVIVTGKVVGVKSYWNPEKTLIYTDVSIEPEEFTKGRMRRNAVIRVVGGEVGEMSLVVDEMPVFSPGEQVTVNLVKGCDEGVFEVLGGAQGKGSTLGGRPKPPPPLFYYDYSGYKRDPAVCNYYINQGLLDKGWESALQRAGDSWSLAGSAFRFNDSGATSIRAAGFDGVNIISDSDFGATSSYWAVCYGFFRRKVLVEDDIIFNTQPTSVYLSGAILSARRRRRPEHRVPRDGSLPASSWICGRAIRASRRCSGQHLAERPRSAASTSATETGSSSSILPCHSGVGCADSQGIENRNRE